MPFFSKCALLWTRFKLKFHFRRQFETVIHDIGHIDISELYGIQQRFLVLAAVKWDAPARIRRFVVDACSRTIFFYVACNKPLANFEVGSIYYFRRADL